MCVFPGLLTVTPANGTATITPFSLEASQFGDIDQPLMYQFCYKKTENGVLVSDCLAPPSEESALDGLLLVPGEFFV